MATWESNPERGQEAAGRAAWWAEEATWPDLKGSGVGVEPEMGLLKTDKRG